MNTIIENVPLEKLSVEQIRAIRQILYYQLFKHPLRIDEIDNGSVVRKGLDDLVSQGILNKMDNHFSIEASDKNLIKRLAGSKMYDEMMPRAIKRAKFIYQFPFVEGVYISGSMSKGFIAEDGDVDFFIVTKPGRLWLCRTLLILFKKVFLANNRKLFCLNYFVDSDHMEIEEKNIFTATELITLMPICDSGINKEFNNKNNWVKNFYPETPFRPSLLGKLKKNLLSKFLELILKTPVGKWLDKMTMNLTLKVWDDKFGDFKPKDFDLALKSRSYVSKHHPQNFQKKVLTEFEVKVNDFEKKHGIDLSL